MLEYTYILFAHQILPSLDFCLSSSKENLIEWWVIILSQIQIQPMIF